MGYVQEAVQNCTAHLVTIYGRFKLPQESENLFKMGYDLELDISSELKSDAASSSQTAIGILGWMIKLEKINIITKVMMLSSHVALPRGEH